MAAQALCLILDAVVLASGEYPVSPEAVALAGAARQVQAELGGGRSGATLSIVAIEDATGDSAPAEALRNLASSEVTSVRLAPDAPAELSTCPGDPERAILVTANEGHPTGPGVTRWLLGDAVAGLGGVGEAGRRLREELGLPVPRTMKPSMIRGGLVLLPATTPPETLLQAVYDQPTTSWIRLGGQPVLYTENPDQEDALMALPGAKRLSFGVSLAQLALTEGEPRAGTEILHRGQSAALVSAPDGTKPAGTSWTERQFATLP